MMAAVWLATPVGVSCAVSAAVRVDPNSTMSAPAATACSAAPARLSPVARIAPADRLSVSTRPCQPSWLRNRPLMAALERLAGPVVRPGTVALATMTAETLASVPRKAGMAPCSSWVRGSVWAGPSSVLPLEWPRPGKCLTVLRSPPAASPWANALA